MEKIEIIKPDDWHVHFRDDEILQAVVPETTRHFARSIVMPNLIPPILNSKQAIEYKQKIEKAIPLTDSFEPFMTIYLTEETNKHELKNAHESGAVFAVKLYPAGATTNSDSGVKDITKVMPVLETMAEIGMPLLIHGEVTNKEVDIFDREKIFLENVLSIICKEFPDLKITMEHITTQEAIDYVQENKNKLAASITPHHLALNRNSMFAGGIRPHNYCLPILKREKHRKALVKAATSGKSNFFLGTDTAPHLRGDKESSCGCAGIFNTTYSLSIIAEIFDKEKSLDKLEAFVSINGARHYSLKCNEEKITLEKFNKPMSFKKSLKFQDKEIQIFKPDFPIYWKVKD